MAKKILKTLCVLFILPIIVLASCENKDDDGSKKIGETGIAADFSADFEANYRSSQFKGCISASSQKLITISLTYPETIAGLQISYRAGEIQIVRDELVCSADEAYIPDRSLPSVIKSILDGMNGGRAEKIKKDDEGQTYNLKTDLGNAVVNSDGVYLRKAYIKDIDFEVKFENVRELS